MSEWVVVMVRDGGARWSHLALPLNQLLVLCDLPREGKLTPHHPCDDIRLVVPIGVHVDRERLHEYKGEGRRKRRGE